jgi:PEP-CTERM motif
MRRIVLVLWALALLLSGVGPAAAQGNNPIITADEKGNGSLTFPASAPVPTIGVLGQDPGPGGRSNALIYSLLGPPSLVAGDVLVTEPGGAVGDIIRFNAASDQNPAEFVFYSQPGGTDLADLAGFPSANYTNVLTIPEINGIINFTPGSGQPGFVAGFSATYNLSSVDPAPSAIPEPTSLVLFGMATAGCLGWRRWRTRRARSTSAAPEA